MCGRYASARDKHQLLEEFQVELTGDPEEELGPDYNVAPTKNVYAVLQPRAQGRPRRAGAAVAGGAVGLVPAWAKDPSIGSRMINARLETVAEKPAFRKAFAERRCLLPADGYFEWYAGRSATRRRSSRTSSTRPTAGCWRWPGCTSSGGTRA